MARSLSSPRVAIAITDPPRMASPHCILPIIYLRRRRRRGAIWRHDGHLLVDQGDGAVLHLAGGITLGVDVGNLLQLQCAFERNRVVDAATRDRVKSVRVWNRDATSSTSGAIFSVCSNSRGSWRKRVYVRPVWTPHGGQWRRALLARSRSPSRSSATSCDVNALVDATPISGPACV